MTGKNVLAENRKREAKDRPIWVIKCPAPDSEKKVRWGDYAYAVALKRYLDRMGMYTSDRPCTRTGTVK